MTRDAQSIDDVLDRLQEIIEWSGRDGSRAGYFAALYRRVTLEVRGRIQAGCFDDPERMERLDVVFAGRYLEAFEAWQSGRETTASWRRAFAATGEYWPIVLQHLLLGMNAHINLDLGVAAAQTVAARDLEELRGDFERINGILAELVAGVQNSLAEVWPVLRILNRYLGSADDILINFSMERARSHAWRVAQRLAPLSESEREGEIHRLDSRVAGLGAAIRRPGFTLGLVTRLVRLGEWKTVRETIGILR